MNLNNFFTNNAEVIGTVTDILSAKIEGEGDDKKYITEFLIETKRKSEAKDILPCRLVSEGMKIEIEPGVRYKIEGEWICISDRGHFVSHFEVAKIRKAFDNETEDTNALTFRAALSKKSSMRETPLGRVIVDALFYIPNYLEAPEGSKQFQCVCFDKIARQVGQFVPGRVYDIIGRIQSRTYTRAADNTCGTTYEITPYAVRECIGNAAEAVRLLLGLNETERNYYAAKRKEAGRRGAIHY